jgi:hypothetical protein
MKTIATSLLLLSLFFGCESCNKNDPGSKATRSTQIQIQLHHDFDGKKGIPKGWTIGETNGQGTPATWGKVPGKSGDGFGIIKTENSGSTFNVALLNDLVHKDFVAELWVKARTGNEDQGGGLVWRAKNFDNYYICRWNPLEDNFRFYKVVKGRRSMLATSQVKTDSKPWHLIRVEAKGPKVRIFFDGKLRMESEDETFQGAGKFGFWTKADAATSFDELKLDV